MSPVASLHHPSLTIITITVKELMSRQSCLLPFVCPLSILLHDSTKALLTITLDILDCQSHARRLGEGLIDASVALGGAFC